MPESPVRELRLALTVEHTRRPSPSTATSSACRWSRPSRGRAAAGSSWTPAGPPWILAAGQAELVDEIEVGARVAGPVRVAL